MEGGGVQLVGGVEGWRGADKKMGYTFMYKKMGGTKTRAQYDSEPMLVSGKLQKINLYITCNNILNAK